MTKPTYEDLLATIDAQHTAIDWLFASLIVATRSGAKNEPFFPSKSPIWPTVKNTVKILQAARS